MKRVQYRDADRGGEAEGLQRGEDRVHGPAKFDWPRRSAAARVTRLAMNTQPDSRR